MTFNFLKNLVRSALNMRHYVNLCICTVLAICHDMHGLHMLRHCV